MVRCGKCGGIRVQIAAWVDANTDEVLGDYGSWDSNDTAFCADCDAHVTLIADVEIVHGTQSTQSPPAL